MKKKHMIAFFLMFTLIFPPFIEPVLATESIDLSGYVFAKNPFDYGQPPEGIYPFRYIGSKPYFSMDIDTSDCSLDALYLYDQKLDIVIELTNGPVGSYTATKDCVFYATENNTIFQTSYTGAEKVQVYQGDRGAITDMDSYLQYLYFIESGQFLVVLDTQNGIAETVAVIPNIVSSVMISHDQIVCGTSDDTHFLLEIQSKEITQLAGDYAASALITKAVLSAAEMTVLETPPAGIMSVYAPSAVNDISFPLDEYPARVPDTDDFQEIYKNGARPVPLSWFHINQDAPCSSTNCIRYRHANECQGFAMYAHDIYHHVHEPEGGYNAWFTDRHTVYSGIQFKDDDGLVSSALAISFFSTLNEGALVRYDSSYNSHPNGPTDGDHAFIYVTRDSNGIWVYECNQKYEGVSQGNCGIHYQYYTYKELARRCASIVYHINHTYNTTWEYESGYYHKFNCSQQLSSGDACACYRRVMHDSLTVSFVSIVQHRSVSACCGTHDENHTEPLEYICVSNTQHKVQAGCCDDEISQNHMFVNDRCKLCHYLKDSMAINKKRGPVIQAVAITE